MRVFEVRENNKENFNDTVNKKLEEMDNTGIEVIDIKYTMTIGNSYAFILYKEKRLE